MNPDIMANYKDIEVNGKPIRIGRLTVEKESKIWFDELAPRLAPLIGDLLDRGAPLIVGRRGGPPPTFDFGTLFRQLTKELSHDRVQALAKLLLENTQHDGRALMGQLSTVVGSTWNLLQVIKEALAFFYADFWQALGSLPSLLATAAKVWKGQPEGATTPETTDSEALTDPPSATGSPSSTS